MRKWRTRQDARQSPPAAQPKRFPGSEAHGRLSATIVGAGLLALTSVPELFDYAERLS